MFFQSSEDFVLAGARSLFEEKIMSMNCASKRLKKTCIFCRTSGKKDELTNEALNLALDFKVNRRIHLVYDGGSIELMCQVAHIVKSRGGHMIGVIPKALMDAELTSSTVEKLVTVTDMHQTKAQMARQGGAFIALPGGYGTLEELVEFVTWNQLGIYKKPIGLLNVDGSCVTLLSSTSNWRKNSLTI